MVVIGSGIGGLSCAALLAKYGVKVSVRLHKLAIASWSDAVLHAMCHAGLHHDACACMMNIVCRACQA